MWKNSALRRVYRPEGVHGKCTGFEFSGTPQLYWSSQERIISLPKGRVFPITHELYLEKCHFGPLLLLSSYFIECFAQDFGGPTVGSDDEQTGNRIVPCFVTSFFQPAHILGITSCGHEGSYYSIPDLISRRVAVLRGHKFEFENAHYYTSYECCIIVVSCQRGRRISCLA